MSPKTKLKPDLGDFDFCGSSDGHSFGIGSKPIDFPRRC